MDSKSENILSTALLLSDEDRAVLAEKLIESLDHEYAQDVEIEWQNEIQKRLDDIDSGRVACLPWEEVKARLKRNLHAHA